jgi:hypothetical protein
MSAIFNRSCESTSQIAITRENVSILPCFTNKNNNHQAEKRYKQFLIIFEEKRVRYKIIMEILTLA